MTTILYPAPAAKRAWENLIGLDQQKQLALENLELVLEPNKFQAWANKHHGRNFYLAQRTLQASALLIFTGDVGCGKTALALTVGQALAVKLNCPISMFVAPSNLRGHGLVGQLSGRISEIFAQARAAIPKRGHGLLLIDEGDSIATSREQLQAHHEDRAGVNALIREVDESAENSQRLAVILATNRGNALDPALLRRAIHVVTFARPTGEQLRALWQHLLQGIKHRGSQLDALMRGHGDGVYSTSDIIHRVGRMAMLTAYKAGRKLTVDDFLQAIQVIKPTPVFSGVRA